MLDSLFRNKDPKASMVSRPFVGSRPFESNDSMFFFGRERDAAILANMIAAHSLTILYGDSGVGKSSLLNTVLSERLTAIDPGWLLVYFNEWQPGAASKLLTLVSSRINRSEPLSIQALSKTLVEYSSCNDLPILLIFDQFEEFFLYNNQESDQISSELAKIANRRSGQVNILLSLRSDGLFLLDKLRIKIPQIFNSMIHIDALDAKSAVDCIINPIGVYNRIGNANIKIPDKTSALVSSLVDGSKYSQIMSRLSGRGHGVTGIESLNDRIVAPFLQLSLDTLWESCVVRKHQDHLDLLTLRELAGLPAIRSGDEDSAISADAVVLIVQRHVDNVLSLFSDEQKALAATIFERMILPSGQKVAVTLRDLEPHLTEGRVREPKDSLQAKDVLNKLSEDGNARLLKRVTTPLIESETAYQIVHDAMAVPILDWVDRYRSSARIRVERERSKRKTFRIFGATLLVSLAIVGGLFANARGGKVSRVKQLVAFAEQSTLPGFRLPILLSLTALNESRSPLWFLNEPHTLKVLESRLVQSPRDGGTFIATGFDAVHGRITWMDLEEGREVIFVCLLVQSTNCDKENKVAVYKLVAPPRGPKASSNRFLQNAVVPAIGFVEGLDTPVVIRDGMIFYLDSSDKPNNDPKEWRSVDVADVIKDDLTTIRFALFSISSGTIELIIPDWQSREQRVATIKFSPGSEPPFAVSGDVLKIRWDQPSDPVPITSSGGNFSAALAVGGEDASIKQCQDRSVIDPATQLPSKAVVLSVWSKSQMRPNQVKLCSTALPQIRGGVGFSNDERFVGTLVQRIVRVFDVEGHPDFELNISNAGVPVGDRLATAIGPQFANGTLAIHREGDQNWKSSWQADGGVVVVSGSAGPKGTSVQSGEGGQSNVKTSGYDRLLYGSPPPGQAPIAASKLNFGGSGEFLVMQALNFQNKQSTMMVWDLRRKWKDEISAVISAGGEQLVNFACRIASHDPSAESGHPIFNEPERLVWAVDDSAPCTAK
jgi:hypothetical protein